MYTKLGQVRLKSGEEVEAGVVRGPDAPWADRVAPLLGHKGQLWRWQVEQLLREESGVEPYFYLLHRRGAALSNIMTVEHGGVGILGHVFTRVEDRRQGATSSLMKLQMDDFNRRGGRALYLATGFDSPPYHIYAGFGFQSISAGNGLMSYHRAGAEAFARSYFAPAPVKVEPIAWRHWCAAAPLFLGEDAVYVRCAPLKMMGRCLTEGPLLALLREEWERKSRGQAAQGLALVSRGTGAVVGLSARGPDPTWPGVEVVDVYCHREFWSSGVELLEGVLPTDGRPVLAYADAGSEAKRLTLESCRFRKVGALPMRVGEGAWPQGLGVEVLVFERR